MTRLDRERGLAGVADDAMYLWRVRHAARWERLGCREAAEDYATAIAKRYLGLYVERYAEPLHPAYTTDMARRESVRAQVRAVLEAE